MTIEFTAFPHTEKEENPKFPYLFILALKSIKID